MMIIPKVREKRICRGWWKGRNDSAFRSYADATEIKREFSRGKIRKSVYSA